MNDKMGHVTSNMRVRLTQLGLTMTQLEEASGITRQHIHRAVTRPANRKVQTIAKIGLLLFCPVQALLSSDPSDVTRQPLPPPTFLDSLRRHRAAFGLERDAKPVEWDRFVAVVLDDWRNTETARPVEE